MDPSSSSSPEMPQQSVTVRAKFAWRVLLISNLALGAYLFIKPISKKTPAEDQAKAASEVPSTPTVTTAEVYEEPVFFPPITQPVKVREPIPEDQQRELFKWILEEKRKVKHQSREEKKKLDEEKAILKQFIRAESIQKI